MPRVPSLRMTSWKVLTIICLTTSMKYFLMQLIISFRCSLTMFFMVANITRLGSNCLLYSLISCLEMSTFPPCTCCPTSCAFDHSESPTLSLVGCWGALSPLVSSISVWCLVQAIILPQNNHTYPIRHTKKIFHRNFSYVKYLLSEVILWFLIKGNKVPG